MKEQLGHPSVNLMSTGKLSKSKFDSYPEHFLINECFSFSFGIFDCHFQKVLSVENTHSEIESLWHGALHWSFCEKEGKVSRSCSLFLSSQFCTYS